MSDATQVFRADGEQWFNTMARMQDQFDKLIQKSTELTKTSKDAVNELKQAGSNLKQGMSDSRNEATAFGESLMSAATTVAAMAASYFSIATLAKTITEEHEKQRSLQEKARQTQMTVADAEQEVIRNLGAKDDATAANFIQRIRSMSSTAGVADVKTTLGAYSQALSTSGGDQEMAMNALRSSLRMAARAPGELSSITGGVIGIQQANRTLTSDQALAFMMSIGNVANIADTSKIAVNAPVAISAAVESSLGGAASTEDNMKVGGALWAYLAEKGKDKTGESTGTQAINLAIGMRDFFAEKGNDPGDIGGRIKRLQSDENLRREFLGSSHMKGEARFRTGIEGLLSGRETLDSRVGGLSFDTAIVDALESQLNNSTSSLRLQRDQAKIEALRQQMELTDVKGARFQQGRDAFQNITDIGRRTFTGFEKQFAGAIMDNVLWGAEFWSDEKALKDRIGTAEKFVSSMRSQAVTSEQREYLELAKENLKVLKSIQEELNQKNALDSSRAAAVDAARGL